MQQLFISNVYNSSLFLIDGVRKIQFHVYNTIPNDLNTSLKGGLVNCFAPQKIKIKIKIQLEVEK